MRHAKRVGLICLGLFSLLSGCSQSTTPGNPEPAGRTTAPQPVKRVFDVNSGPHAAGKQVLVAHGCFRCHTINQARGPIGDGQDDTLPREAGPELGTAGADPARTVEWFMAFIRNPRFEVPTIRMPPYEGKINEKDLRALAEYLVSLK